VKDIVVKLLCGKSQANHEIYRIQIRCSISCEQRSVFRLSPAAFSPIDAAVAMQIRPSKDMWSC